MLAVSLPQHPQQVLLESARQSLLTSTTGSHATVTRIKQSTTLHSTCSNQTSLDQPSQNKRKKEPSCGICFDVDGVLAHGTRPIPSAPGAMKRLIDSKGRFRVPVAFVTNSLSSRADKASKLSELLDVQVRPEQMILAPGPLQMFTELHDKFCLIVGQGKILDIAEELGFKNMCTIEDICRTYPLLDVADHTNRKRNEAILEFQEPTFPHIEAVVLLGEPSRWESALQILIDVLLTGGRPNGPRLPVHQTNLPVIACNMDLEFKDRAPTPRFGHGAFLACLESLYKKLTGKDLEYDALVGKPSEITFRFAEHVLNEERQYLSYQQPLERMYLIGDTPDVDIVGSNLYQRFIDRQSKLASATPTDYAASNNNISVESQPNVAIIMEKQDSEIFNEQPDVEIPSSRNCSSSSLLHQSTVYSILSILVCTGVYQPSAFTEPLANHAPDSHHGHRDFPHGKDLKMPTKICKDVLEAIAYICEKEDL